MNKLFLTFSLFFLALSPILGLSQSHSINIRLIGNCGLHITDGTLDVYVDFPYKSGAYNYMEYNPSELDSVADNSIFIFTHRHADHYSKKLLRRYSGKILGPWKVKKKRRLSLQQLNDSIPHFSVEVFKTSHRFAFKHNSYLITWHGKRIFLSGDTESAETIALQSNMDWAFIPAWLIMDANEKGIKIDTRMVGLYHIGPNDKITSDNPKIKLFDRQGETISIPL